MRGYLEGIFVFDDVGVFQLFEDGDLSSDFLFGDEFSVHLLDGYFPTGFDVAAAVDLAEGALPDAVFFGKDVVPHLDLNIIVHHLLLTRPTHQGSME